MSDASLTLGFVGLGVMGGPMAGHLIRAGHRVCVWNRSPEKAAPLRDQGATVCDSLAELASKCSIVFLCVTRTEDVRACIEEMVPSAKPNTVFVDHSTISPEGAESIAQFLKQNGMRFIDAPITGGSMGAQAGKLTIFCGGSETDIEQILPIISAYAKRAERVGGSGKGQMMKIANQIAVGGALLALCETLAFAEKAGLDVQLAKDMIGGGSGGSWAFDNYGPKILKRDWSPGFSIANQRKDFGYCKEAANKIHAGIPGTELVDRLLAILSEQGHDDWTTAALYEVMMGIED